jgi:hypothetical protein
VNQRSATLDPKNPARMLMNTDHRSICKFDSNTEAFRVVNSELNAILATLKHQSTDSDVQYEHLPGHPRFAAHAYPPNGRFWCEGAPEINDRASSQVHCVGREQELGLLESYSTAEPHAKLTAVKGIGGIG